jgi:hypothetical protein
MAEEEDATDECALCSRCGMEALGAIGDEILCESCYHVSGSCCGLSEDC